MRCLFTITIAAMIYVWFPQDLTFDSVKGAENFPLLDSFHWEIQRLYAAPAFTVKVKYVHVKLSRSAHTGGWVGGWV